MPDDAFASFFNFQYPLTMGSQISLIQDVPDTTGNITLQSPTQIGLAPGYYLVSYKVSAVFRTPNYMQVTPIYNGTPRLEYGIYFATNADGSSAYGASFFILRASQATQLSLNYSGSGNAVEGEINLTVLKLRRELS